MPSSLPTSPLTASDAMPTTAAASVAPSSRPPPPPPAPSSPATGVAGAPPLFEVVSPLAASPRPHAIRRRPVLDLPASSAAAPLVLRASGETGLTSTSATPGGPCRSRPTVRGGCGSLGVRAGHSARALAPAAAPAGGGTACCEEEEEAPVPFKLPPPPASGERSAPPPPPPLPPPALAPPDGG